MKPAQFRFAGATAVVTGAAGGMGEHLARGLAERGSALLLVDRDAGKLDAVASSIRAAYPDAAVTTFVVDLAERDAVDQVAAELLAATDTVDLLINNAGVALAGMFDQITMDDFDWVMAVNFHAPVLLTHHLLPLMRPGAHIVNVSSLFGLVAPRGQSAYSSSKFALRGFTEALRNELLPRGIGTTSVHPGGIRTNIARNARLGGNLDEAALKKARGDFDRLLTFPADRAAQLMLEAVKNRTPRLLIGLSATLPDVVARVAPLSFGTLQRHLASVSRLPAVLRRGSGTSRDTGSPAQPDGVLGEGHLRVDGVRIRYRDEGAAEKTPVLLLHGIGRSLEDWEGLYARLAPDHRVISIDLPGFGLSERTAGRYSMETMARFVLAALDTLGERRPLHVVGNSLGGAVAMKISALAPERVRSLVLANSAGFGKEVTIALRLLAVRPVGRFLLRDTSRKAAYRTERALFYDRAFVTEERLDHAQEVGRNPVHDDVMLAVAGHLGTFGGVRRRWRTELLRSVAAQRKPTLVIWGDEDRVLPASHLEHARTAFPHAEFHLFDKCGHMPQIEREEEFDALVRRFVAGADADPAAPTHQGFRSV